MVVTALCVDFMMRGKNKWKNFYLTIHFLEFLLV
jgi:hypothetical protein